MANQPSGSDYVVVFEGFSGEGVRTWRTFRDANELNLFMENAPEGTSVVRQGITNQEAIQICLEVPTTTLTRAAFKRSTLPDGSLDEQKLKLELAGVDFVNLIRRKEINN